MTASMTELLAHLQSESAKMLRAYAAQPKLAEEHYAHEKRARTGGHAGRQVHELVQNAVDAALASARSGRVEVHLVDDYLYVANSGEAISKEGVDALLLAHQSPKREHSIGRYGVGFMSIAGITDQVEFFTQDGAFYFSRSVSEARIREAAPDAPMDLPMLKLAYPMSRSDYIAATAADATLRSLVRWSGTVVRMSLGDLNARETVRHEIDSFCPEFLLNFPGELDFRIRSPQSRPSDLVVRSVCTDRHLLRYAGGGDVEYLVTERQFVLPTALLNNLLDEGEITAADLMSCCTVRWVVEETQRSGTPGHMWRYFPTLQNSPVPGFLHAPWKLTADNHVMQASAFNDWLMDCAAEIIVAALSRLATATDPGRPLDLLPDCGVEGDRVVRTMSRKLWDRLHRAALIADSHGCLCPSQVLDLPPKEVLTAPEPVRTLSDWYSLRPTEIVDDGLARRGFRWVHPSIMTNAVRLQRMLAGPFKFRTECQLVDWFGAVAGPRVQRSIRLVQLADSLRRGADSDRMVRSLRVVLSRRNTLVEPAKIRLAFEGARAAPELELLRGEDLVHEDVAAQLWETLIAEPFSLKRVHATSTKAAVAAEIDALASKENWHGLMHPLDVGRQTSPSRWGRSGFSGGHLVALSKLPVADAVALINERRWLRIPLMNARGEWRVHTALFSPAWAARWQVVPDDHPDSYADPEKNGVSPQLIDAIIPDDPRATVDCDAVPDLSPRLIESYQRLCVRIATNARLGRLVHPISHTETQPWFAGLHEPDEVAVGTPSVEYTSTPRPREIAIRRVGASGSTALTPMPAVQLDIRKRPTRLTAAWSEYVLAASEVNPACLDAFVIVDSRSVPASRRAFPPAQLRILLLLKLALSSAVFVGADVLVFDWIWLDTPDAGARLIATLNTHARSTAHSDFLRLVLEHLNRMDRVLRSGTSPRFLGRTSVVLSSSELRIQTAGLLGSWAGTRVAAALYSTLVEQGVDLSSTTLSFGGLRCQMPDVYALDEVLANGTPEDVRTLIGDAPFLALSPEGIRRARQQGARVLGETAGRLREADGETSDLLTALGIDEGAEYAESGAQATEGTQLSAFVAERIVFADGAGNITRELTDAIELESDGRGGYRVLIPTLILAAADENPLERARLLVWVLSKVSTTLRGQVSLDEGPAAVVCERLREEALLSIRGLPGVEEKLAAAMAGNENALRAVLDDIEPDDATDAELPALAFDSLGFGALQAEPVLSRWRLLGLNPPKRWGDNTPTYAFFGELGIELDVSALRTRRSAYLDVPARVTLGPLREYQEAAVKELVGILRGKSEKNRAMVSLPTGAGKTRVAVEAIVTALSELGRPGLVIWIAQSDELLEQAVEAIRQVWAELGDRGKSNPRTLRISRGWGGTRPNVGEPIGRPHVLVTSIQTVVRRIESQQWDLKGVQAIVIDEAHHAIAPSYSRALRGLLEGGLQDAATPVVGLTATPLRGQSDEETDRLVARFQRNLIPAPGQPGSRYDELIAQGVLSQYELSALEYDISFDLDQRERIEYQQFRSIPETAIRRLGEEEEFNQRITERILSLPEDARILVFCCSVNQARKLAPRVSLAARRQGLKLRAASVDGETSRSERVRQIRRFQNGELTCLMNVGVLTTGFDAPKVDTVIVARPTLSTVAYLQMVGRGLRGPASGGTEHCRIINTIRNLERWGMETLPYDRILDAWRQQLQADPP